MAGEIIGYKFSSPVFDFEVLDVVTSAPNLIDIATAFQRMMFESRAEQTKGYITDDNIRTFSDPDNPVLVTKQAENFKKDDADPSWTTVYSRPVAEQAPEGTKELILGVGQAKEFERPNNEKRVGIEKIFVNPFFQKKGIGSAILMTLLETFDDDLTVTTFEFNFNHSVFHLLSSLGFEIVREKSDTYFEVHNLKRSMFVGPAVGRLIADLETRYPWLQDRQEIEGIMQ